ncbi:MAG: hypothetical protein O2U61_06930 [Candidatus Bathyarchaeota archaeon]|nr:hypothetical protein [Candidatus Bathyarchaeota archaeon]
MKREKTSKMIYVPILPKAKAILNKYIEAGDYALPKFSNQKINSYLKEIGGILGINKSISHHMPRKTVASTVLLYNDVPMEIVSELLGPFQYQGYPGILRENCAKEGKSGDGKDF